MQLFCRENSPIHSQQYENMCLQYDHYHTQNYEQKLMFLTNFAKKRQKKIPKSLNRTLCNYPVMKTHMSGTATDYPRMSLNVLTCSILRTYENMPRILKYLMSRNARDIPGWSLIPEYLASRNA